MKKLFFLMMCCSSFLFAGNNDRIGSAGGTVLLVNPWTSSTGWGGAGAVCSRGLESTFLNVASLGFSGPMEIGFSYTNWLGNANIDLNSLGIMFKAGDDNAMALSIVNMDYGTNTRTTVDQPDGGLGTFSPVNTVIALSYSRVFSSSTAAGISLKVLNEAIADVRAVGVAIDAGISYRTGEQKQFKFGVVLKNIGTPMAYSGDGIDVIGEPNGSSINSDLFTLSQRSAGFELPSLLGISVSYDFNFSDAHKLVLAGNFVANSFSSNNYIIGANYRMQQSYGTFYFKLGFLLEESIFNTDIYSIDGRKTDFNPLQAGISYAIHVGSNSSILFDYAFRGSYALGTVHSLGLRYTIQ